MSSISHALSIPNLKMSVNALFVEIGHVEGRTYNGSPLCGLHKSDIIIQAVPKLTPIISPIFHLLNLDEESSWA